MALPPTQQHPAAYQAALLQAQQQQWQRGMQIWGLEVTQEARCGCPPATAAFWASDPHTVRSCCYMCQFIYVCKVLQVSNNLSMPLWLPSGLLSCPDLLPAGPCLTVLQAGFRCRVQCH